MRLFLALLLASLAPADVLSSHNHVKVDHDIFIHGLERAPEDVHFELPWMGNGMWVDVTPGEPVPYHKGPDPRLHARRSGSDEAYAISDLVLPRISEIKKRSLTRRVVTEYEFLGIEGEVIQMKLLSQVHYDEEGNEVRPRAWRLHPGWYGLSGIALLFLVWKGRQQ